MNSKFVFFTLVLTIVSASVLHRFNTSRGDEEKAMDVLAPSLKEVKKILPANTDVAFHFEKLNTDVYLWCRYIMAPHYISIDKNASLDTSLSVYAVDAPDSLVNAFVKPRKTIWQHKDSKYQYYLTATLR